MNEIISLPVELDCPEWCTSHRGQKAIHDGYMPDDVPVNEVKRLGNHSASLMFDQPYPDVKPTAVEVHQTVFTAGDNAPQIYLWHGVHGVENVPGFPPLTSRTFTVLEARALAAALIEAAELVEQIMPDRCACGEPIEPQRDQCIECMVRGEKAARAERRSKLTAVKR